MNIHEYQAKALFKEAGLDVAPGKVFDKKSLSLEAISGLGGPFVVKAQVHAGGRGKAGGIKLVKTAEEAFEAAKKMIGSTLTTYQTAGVAKPIDYVLVERASKIKKELYLAVTLDRENAFPVVVCSEAGGVEIEEVAKKTPEKIVKCHFGIDETISEETFRAFLSGLFTEEGDQAEHLRKKMAHVIAKLATLFLNTDASLIEVNPLGLIEAKAGAAGQLLLLQPVDGKINFDDNALYRHKEVAKLRDLRQEDEREVEAKKFDLSYVGLEGNIGCMVNGAGLAMATMDITKLRGGEPANFLDVGGGASKEKVAAAFKIILRDPRVKAILVNIFGGILRCDVLAEGIIAAQKEVKLNVPLVVRLEGTNVKEGRAILKKSSIPIISADSFEDAAKKAVGVLK